MLKRVQHDGRGGLKVLLLLALPVSGAAFAQDLVPPKLAVQAATVEGFVPRGWRLEARADGDLDGDGKADAALVLRGTDPANVVADSTCEKRFDTNARIVAVLLARPDGYRRVGQSHRLIPRRDNPCQVDPFLDPGQIAIERGTLLLFLERMMSAGGWDAGMTTFKWRWRDGAMRLIGFDYSNVQRNSGEMALLSINYLTGRAKVTIGNVGEDRDKVRWTRLRDRRAPTLGEIGDGLMFDPENMVSSLP